MMPMAYIPTKLHGATTRTLCPCIDGCLIDTNDRWCYVHQAWIDPPRDRVAVDSLDGRPGGH